MIFKSLILEALETIAISGDRKPIPLLSRSIIIAINYFIKEDFQKDTDYSIDKY